MSAYAGGYPRTDSMPPRSTIGHVWLIMRRLRWNSPASEGTMRSLACARGTYTARRPRLTILNGSARSWPMIGSTTTYASRRVA